jgi:hypothetical protein
LVNSKYRKARPIFDKYNPSSDLRKYYDPAQPNNPRPKRKVVMNDTWRSNFNIGDNYGNSV